MIWSVLSTATLAVHGLFVLFVIAGALLALRWPRVLWLQVPSAAWGAAIELGGWICPLTHLENEFRRRAGQQGYAAGFIEERLLGLIYPEGLTPDTQWLLGIAVLAVNAACYAVIYRRCRREAP